MIVSDERVAKFVSDQIGVGFCPPYVAIGLERNGEIVAGILLNHYERADIHATIAGKVWSKGLLKAASSYVFDQLGCERITAVTQKENAVEFARRLGGQIEGRLRNHFGNGHDGTIIGILRSEARY